MHFCAVTVFMLSSIQDMTTFAIPLNYIGLTSSHIVLGSALNSHVKTTSV